MPDITEPLFDAVTILIDNQLKSVRFDETISATITDASKAEFGEYVVTTGLAKFKAYSNGAKYKENDAVLVTIPQGNYDNQKMIIGKQVKDSNTPMVYTEPFDHIINLTNNIVSSSSDCKLFANSSDYLWSINGQGEVSGNPIFSSNDCQYTGYTVFGLSAKFATYMPQMIKGNYGLIVEFVFKNASEQQDNNESQSEQQNNSIKKQFVLDSSEFFGNIYNFNVPITQSAIFDLTDYQDYIITDIKVIPYQRGNFFTNENEEYIPNDVAPDIFIKDLYLCFGEYAENFKEDSAKLITVNSLTYFKEKDNVSITERNTRNLKTIQLRWIHKYDSGKIAVVSENTMPRGYEIRWYKYALGEHSPDEYAGAHWKRFYGKSETADNNGDWLLSSGTSATNKCQVDFQPNVNLANERLKVIVLDTSRLTPVKIIETHSIDFTNDNEVVSSVIPDFLNDLSIHVADGSGGQYFIYNRSSQLYEDQANTERSLQAYFKGAPLLSADCTSIEWTFPTENTMIIPVSAQFDDSTVDYKIKKNLNNTASNNTIALEVVRDGVVYKTFITLTFGTAGTNGSEYTLIVDWDKPSFNKLKAKAGSEITGTICLRDSSNNEINIPSNSLSLSWSIHESNNANLANEQETRELLYPVITTSFFNEDYYFNDGSSPKSDAIYYIYDLNDKRFVQQDNLTVFAAGVQYYRRRIKTGNNTENYKAKIEYILEDNVTSDSYQSKKYFVVINGEYILDPYNSFDETINYYKPSLIRFRNNGAQGLTSALAGNKVTVTANNNIDINSLYVLRITLSNFGNYNLSIDTPILLYNENYTITNLSGPQKVSYLPSGDIEVDKNYYSAEVVDAQSGQDLEKGYWKLFFPNELTQNEENFAPTLAENNPGESNANGYVNPVLKPVGIYIPNAKPFGIQYYDNSNNVILTIPIIVSAERYPSTTLNNWEGKNIETDEGAGTIVASGFAAGKKENNNSFTGVVIGDWSRSDINTEMQKNTGIYGFNKGRMSYAFKDDGTGFIGKDGKGRIYFDGDKSLIYSGNWRKVQGNELINEGMLLDIDDGTIKLQKKNGNYINKIILNAKADDYPLKIGVNNDEKFKVNWDGSAILEGTIYSKDHPSLNSTAPGFFLGPDGLSIGSGFKTDSSGNLILGGSAILSGNLTLSGNITWNTNSNPTKVLYTQVESNKPDQAYSEYGSTSTSTWHKTLGTNDKYASYSYDGGTASSWSAVVQIVGSDADVTKPNIIAALKRAASTDKTFITVTGVATPNIHAGNLYGCNYYGNTFNVICDENDVGSFNLYTNNMDNHALSIEFFQGDAPQINFSSEWGAYPYWNFGSTTIDGHLSLSGTMSDIYSQNIVGVSMTIAKRIILQNESGGYLLYGTQDPTTYFDRKTSLKTPAVGQIYYRI